ncbi:hypothetical protein EDD86DRAFT_15661 [Gorgonomyces haynaldii]|nr:hypothetical protein EDD86DRAFT_15661 [Gorgonomyces haynaldii]
MHLFASILLGSVDAAAINSRLAVPAGTWTTPTGLNVTVAALDLPSSFAAADPSDRRPMQKVTVHCPDGHYEEAFVAVLNATAELSPRDYVNQRADHYCKNPSPAQLQAQGFAVPQQLEKRGSWQETLSTFQFYEASRQESVRMHHANLGCQYADSQIISSTVPLSVEKVDFEQYDYFPSECVLMFYPHILAQEGQFRFVYLFRFKKSSLFSTFDDMVYDMCRNDYDKGSGRLPAWQGCDVDHPMQHNGVVLPPDNNPPPPPPPPAHNCPVNGHWSEADGKCNCNDGYYWTGKRCYACPRHSIIDGHGNCPCEQDFVLYAFECIYQKCPANGHWDVAQDRCICNDGWYWWTNQCFRCPKHSHVTGGGNCACDNGFTWLNGECVSTTCFANSHWDVGQDKCICNDGWYTWNNQCFKCPKHSHVTGGGNCGCDNGFTWLNGECVSTTCPRHSQWNVPQDRCICDNGYTWDGSNCISTQCPRHSHYDVPQDRCICDNDYLWDGSNCVYQKCPTNGHYDGNQDKCICNDGYYWNGNSCVLPSCPRHSHFNWQSLQCDCDNGYNWDGSQCAPSCPANGHYDAGQDKCVCNDGYHEDNGQCSKDMPPPPPPPPPTTPDIPSGPIFIPPRISIDCSHWTSAVSSKEDCSGEASTN